jgi:hypothetical protein
MMTVFARRGATMSEYQYYEFQAIDRPLDAAEQKALRQITSRADITATSLTNEYHFGDFRGDPAKLMEQYFDAHLYYANWGSNTLMLRLPLAGLTMKDVEPYLTEEDDGFSARGTKTHVILCYEMRQDDAPDYDEMGGSLAALIPLRNELLAGDRRPLYLGWLLAIQQAYGEADELTEPPVPPGLKKLSGPQRALADFLDIDPALIAVAAERSPDLREADPATEKERAAWLAALPPGEKDALLLRVASGQGAVVAVELQRRFRDERGPKADEAEGAPRTAGELRERAEQWAAEEEERERQKQARKREAEERRRAEARDKHLASLAGKEDSLWSKVEALVATAKPGKYDEAVEVLTDLRDVAARAGASAAFSTRLRTLRDKHASKRAFLQRLDKKGLS